MTNFSRLFSSCCKPDVAEESSQPPPSDPSPPGRGPSIGMSSLIRDTAHIEQPTPGLAHFYEKIVGNAANGRQAIDLGAGGGRDSKFLHTNGWQVTAIDPNANTADALSDHAQISFVHGTLSDMQAETGSIGLINCQRVTPFMSREQLPDMLRRAAELLSDGGYLCVSFFGPAHSWKNKPGHENKSFYSVKEIQTVLEQTGFHLAADPDESQKSQRAANKDWVPNWHEISVLAKKQSKVKASSMASDLRRQIEPGSSSF